jgi:SAM-dependent methyltransferase
MSLVETETATYEQMWGVETYADHSPGERFVPLFVEMSGAREPQTILDAGCGSGKGALALEALGFHVRLADLTDAGLVPLAKSMPFDQMCLWQPILSQSGYVFGGAFDWVYCCDVMEHLPTAFTMLVAARLLEASRKGVFFSICLQPDVFGAWIGKPLHQTVQPFTWWRDNLREIGRVKEARDLNATGVYLVEPK